MNRFITTSSCLFVLALCCAGQQVTTFKYQIEPLGDPQTVIVHVSRVILSPSQPNGPMASQPELQNALNTLDGVEYAALGKYQVTVRKARLAEWGDVEKAVVEVLAKHLAPGASVEQIPSKPMAVPQGVGCFNLVLPQVPKEAVEQFLRSIIPRKPTA